MEKYRPVAALILSDDFSGEEKFLIVKKPRKNHAWQFPQGGVNNGESLIGAAERELKEECGKELRIKILFNKPIGEMRYNFPAGFTRHKGKFIGAKVQFFRGILDSGEAEIDNQEIVDYKWIKEEEFKEYFTKEYLKFVEKLV